MGRAMELATVHVVGSVNADVTLRVAALPAPGATVLATADPAHAGGGKGANVAVAAARDGARVRLIAAVGDDEAGARSVEELRAEGVDTSGVAVLEDRPTGIATICVDDRGENTIVVAPGANGALDPAHVTAALAGLAAGDVVVISFEIPDDAIAAAARAAAERPGVRLLANPSPVRPLPRDLHAASPLIVANAGEAEALRDATRTIDVVTTLGADGARTPDGTHVPAPETQAADTTGAGDTFTGILAAELARDAPLSGAVTRATTGAALSTRAHGARAGMPHARETDSALRR